MDLPLLECSKIKISTKTFAVYLIAEAVIVQNDLATHYDICVWVEHVTHIIAL
jgi:hypothetical protein